MKSVCRLVTSMVIYSAAQLTLASPNSSNKINWETQTTAALHSIQKSIKNSTPEFVDNIPHFKRWYKKGYNDAINMLKHHNDRSAYFYILSYYTNGFREPHLHSSTPLFSSQPSTIKKIPYQYAGLLIRYDKGRFYVKNKTHSKNLPPMNAELTDCNGQSPSKIITTQIQPFYAASNNEATRSKLSNVLFLDGNPFRKYPSHCQFTVAGKHITYPIHWKTINPQKLSTLRQQFHPNYPFRVRNFGKTGLWISIPSLSTPIQSTNSLLSFITTHMKHFRKYNPIVFDVRGNEGGNSEWAHHILSNLYGKNYFNYKLKQHHWGWYQWRLSQQNLNYMKTSGSWDTSYITQIAAALNKGNTFYPAKKPASSKKSTQAKGALKFHHQLYFLSDSQCFSSCIDFADYLSNLPNVTYIGRETSADTPYGDISWYPLPGGAYFQYPMKVWRDIDPKLLGPYKPKYRYSGNISDTKKLIAWVTYLIT